MVSAPEGDPDYEEVIFTDKAKRYYKKCIIHQDRLVGAILMGDKREFAEFKLREAQEGFDEEGVDAVVLDLPSPWDGIASAARALRGGGRIASLSPTYNQVERCVEVLAEEGFVFLETVEVLVRNIRVSTGKTRPMDRMVSHTGFLTFGRKALKKKSSGNSNTDSDNIDLTV
jgi:tRNA A58 N-methylase Trm61